MAPSISDNTRAQITSNPSAATPDNAITTYTNPASPARRTRSTGAGAFRPAEPFGLRGRLQVRQPSPEVPLQLIPIPWGVALTLFCAALPSPHATDLRLKTEATSRVDQPNVPDLRPKAGATQETGPAQANELDAFMEKVLKRREANRVTLQQYVLDEVETFELLGPGRLPLHRTHREFTWYVRDALHVRSPVRFNGVTVCESARDRYEKDWIRRELARLERRKKKDAAAATGEEPPEPDQQTDVPVAMVIPAPRFVSEAYFLDFKFEPGNYFLAGREPVEGHQVLRIEYYPERMFDDEEDEAQRERRKRARDQHNRMRFEDRVDRQMDKTSLITLWVDPAEHQIVKYTFENVWLDFLPGAWLVRVDDLRASMTMGQPFPGVWLPREMTIHAGVSLAPGSFDATYARAFSEYREAEVKTKIRVPKSEGVRDLREVPGIRVQSSLAIVEAAIDFLEPSPGRPSEPHGPVEPVAQHPVEPPEVIREIRVHGNAWLSDAEVIRLAAVVPGELVTADTLAQIEQRLKDSGRFQAIEVRKRYRSLTDTTDVALVLVVHERPGITSDSREPDPLGAPWRRVRSRLMFLPIVTYADGYGFTYGARFSTVNLLGAGERVSVPLTWGGTRRAAVEFDRTFETGPLTRVHSTFGIWQRENPHFRLDERRVEWTGRVERHVARIVRGGFEASRSDVDFGTLDDRHWTLAADIALDTRRDPAFPRNAVLIGGGWTGLHPRGRPRIDRYTVDARGYAGLVGQSVIAMRAKYSGSAAAVPLYERLLVGGSPTLRGFRAGTSSGDRMFVTSAELRVPLTSVISGSRLGITAFLDAAKAYEFRQRFEDAEWHTGAGGGLFLIASVLRLNLDVAHGLKTGHTRVHLSAGFGW